MTMVAAFQTVHAYGGTSRIARVDVLRSMSEAEPIWRAFEAASPLATPYQTFDLLNSWQSTVGNHDGAAPFIVVAYDGHNRPVALLPLSVSRESGAQVARFMGGKHPTFNMGLFQSAFASAATAGDVQRIIDAIAHEAGGIDVLALMQQPKTWRGVANPFAQVMDQPSTNPVPSMTMAPNAKPEDRVSTSTRRRLRNKERKLQTLPGYRYFVAETDADIHRLLDAFFVIKPQRMALSKLPNVFADDATKAFIREACTAKLPNGRRAIELHALECDDEMISIFACVAGGQRFSTMFNTYTISENARYSPGLILLRDMIDHYGELGYTSYDFGVGSDEYKMTFCKEDEPIVDSFIPLTARGRLAALGLSSLTHAKRLVKQNPALMQMAQLLRNALQR
ncbi:MAG: GNAT family N-acetyltransferase [Rhizobiales bacterium]|nr:GNAT family N-acetyltransferase [Hyphomicrobiales bacterium]